MASGWGLGARGDGRLHMYFSARRDIEAVALADGVADRLVQVASNHRADQFIEGDFWFPAEALFGSGCVNGAPQFVKMPGDHHHVLAMDSKHQSRPKFCGG